MKENNTMINSSVEKISKDKYERMFTTNPNLKQLIDQLSLSPTNLEDKSSEHFNDTIF